MLTHCVYCITYPYWMIYVTVFAHTWSLFLVVKISFGIVKLIEMHNGD